ncbi:glycosyltransferase, family 8 [Acetobacteraceae bacterium AT-5844]|nr:glycosyltransferase, family 8 [Acetobacteraceae bacterium AT-5844]
MAETSLPAAAPTGGEKPRIHVACCFDARMAMPAGVLAASVAATTTDAHVTFYMLHAPGVSAQLQALKAALDSGDFTVIPCEVSGDRSDLTVNRQYPEAIYYRFFLPDIVPADRVIYLDTDMIVRRSLRELYEMDLGGAPLAATKDYALTSHMRDHGMPVVFRGAFIPVDDYCRDVLGLDLSQKDYFNTGILVMDLKLMREQQTMERCLAFCRENPGLVMSDQDAANHVVQGNFRQLDVRWNSFTYLYAEYFPEGGKRKGPDLFGGYGDSLQAPPGQWRDILTQWAFDPWVVHFAFQSKPWVGGHRRTAYDGEFWAHAARTPFLKELRRGLMTSTMRYGAWLAWYHNPVRAYLRQPHVKRAVRGAVCSVGVDRLRPRYRLKQLLGWMTGRGA